MYIPVYSFTDSSIEGQRLQPQTHVHRQTRLRFPRRRHLPHPRPCWPPGYLRITSQAGSGSRVHSETAPHRQAQVWHSPLCSSSFSGSFRNLYCQRRPFQILHRTLPGAESEKPQSCVHAFNELLAEHSQWEFRALGQLQHRKQAHVFQCPLSSRLQRSGH